jgi:hypothetical protein
MSGERTGALAEAAPAQPRLRPRLTAVSLRATRDALRDAPRPLDPGPRSLLEHRFGRPLDDVRVHAGPRAAEAAHQQDSEAFTVGRDIVFGAGRYAPETSEGLELLAHEVAHTIQQDGAAGRAPLARLTSTVPGDALEREADAAARAVVAGPARAGAAGAMLQTRAAAPVLARREIAWEPIPGGPKGAGDPEQTIEEWEKESDHVVRFKVPKLSLPSEKGPVLKAYEETAKGGGLQATVSFSGGRPKAGLWQARGSTPELNRRWLTKVGWAEKEANTRWYESGGKRGTGFPKGNPGVAGSTCDIDHIVELQLGGTNVPSNLAPLNSDPNRKSGRDLWTTISGIASKLRPLVPAQKNEVNVILSFESVEQIGGPVPESSGTCQPGGPCTCSDVDACAMKGKVQREAAAGTGPYTLLAGGQTAAFTVPNVTTAALLTDTPENAAQAELVPGMILQSLERPGEKHLVRAKVESSPYVKGRAKATRLPITIRDNKDEIVMDAVPEGEKDRRLRIKGTQNPRVNFTYPYLSTGWLKLGLGDTGLTGEGKLRPSLPLLNRHEIGVKFGEGRFTGELQADPKKLALPIPGFKVREAALKADLAPELNLTGYADFEIGKVVTGHIEAQPGAGLVWLKGELNAKIPKLEQAKGEVEYRNGDLKGKLAIATEQLAMLPGSPTGTLTLWLDNRGVSAEGAVKLTVPRVGEVDLTASRRPGASLLLTGEGTFALRGLKPVTVKVRYDGEHFSAEGKTGITYKGLTGDVTVRYWDGRFSGTAEASFATKRVSGRVEIKIEPDGELSGEGQATVLISNDPLVRGSIGVKKPPRQELDVVGQLLLPPVILLVKPKEAGDTIFSKSFVLPFAGVVDLELGAEIGWAAGIGPITIHDAKVGVGFKPFAEEADFRLEASATLLIPAFATIRAALKIGLGVGIPYIVGAFAGIRLNGAVTIRGGLSDHFDLVYAQGRFTASNTIKVEGALELSGRLSGYVHVGAIADLIDIYTHTWTLATWVWKPGFGFLLLIPFTYASDKPFQLPSTNEMTLKTGNFSPEGISGDTKRALGV